MLYVSYVRSWIDAHVKSDKGATMVEYALLVALIGVALIIVVWALTGGISTTFNKATTKLGGTAATPVS